MSYQQLTEANMHTFIQNHSDTARRPYIIQNKL